MEIEREQRRTPTQPAPTPTPAPRSPSARTSTSATATFERVTYAREVSYAVGGLFIALGLVGFVVDNFLGAHLSYAHNWIHLLSGVIGVICAYDSRKSARYFALVAGAVYGLLGILGFALGVPAEASFGQVGRDSSLWVLSPQVLEFGTADHILHLLFAAALLIGGVMHYQRRADASKVY